MAQWVLYLAISTSIGFAWTGLYVLVMSSFGEGGILDLCETILPWFLGASFTTGLVFRLAALWKRRTPSIWYATLIPGIGAFFFLAMMASPRFVDAEDMVMGLLATLAATYVCGGIVILPLSALHTKALQWLHAHMNQWAPRASVRAIRQVGYATACGCLLFATEIPRYRDMKARERAKEVAKSYEVKVSEKAILLSQRDEVDPETYLPVQDAHFRVPGGIAWPPKPSAIGVSQMDNATDVRLRFEKITGHRIPANAELEQVKWYDASGWIEASRFRTPEADYVEFRHF